MSRNENIYWHAFKLVDRIGPLRFKRLYNYFNTLKQAYKATGKELEKTGMEKEIIKEIIKIREEIDLEEELKSLEKENIEIVTIKDKNYPSLLKEIYDPPPVLYVKGKLKKDELALAVVGTRKASSYGRTVTLDLVPKLSQAGLTIVSGLALGIDAFAHEATIKVKGRGIGVLASGLDRVYPQTNQKLSEKILESGGVLISEYPLGVAALRHHFPIRNRIISGISLGTLVVEASQKSGALITARQALEQNREVFTVPGSIYSENSQGPNNLIKMGVKPVTEPEDILETLNIKQKANFQKIRKIVAESKEEEIILKILSKEPIHIDQIVKKGNLTASSVNSTLTLMEMKGKVRNLGNMYYVLAL